MDCFNPHPASLPGDAKLGHELPYILLVSIRTRHRCRVMRKIAVWGLTEEQFQSAPGIAAG